MEQWAGSDQSSDLSSNFKGGLVCFKRSLSPHWFSVFIALFPYCPLKGLYHMHGLPLWLAWSRFRSGMENMLRLKRYFQYGQSYVMLKGVQTTALCHTEKCTSKGLDGVGQGEDVYTLPAGSLFIITLTESFIGKNTGWVNFLNVLNLLH